MEGIVTWGPRILLAVAAVGIPILIGWWAWTRYLGAPVSGLYAGLRVTWRALLDKKNTVMYPIQKVDVAPRWHGLLALPIDPQTGSDKCIICFQCERVCPDRCIHIEAGGKGKDRVLTRFDIEMDKCCYCGLCVEVCPTEAIVFVPHYETSTYNRANLLYSLQDLRRAAPKEPIAHGVIKMRGMA